MQIRVGLENGFEGRSIAWALDYPGCFAYGQDGAEALLSVPQALLVYADWLGTHTQNSWLADLGNFDVRLVESFEVYSIDPQFDPVPEGYLINAFFRHDWKPLTKTEVDRTQQLLAWSHAELLEFASSLSPEALDAKIPEERWSRLGIVAHVATAKWWLMDRLGLAGTARAELPKDVFERFEFTHERLLEVLPGLAGVEQVVGKDGEIWSPRKLVRRAVWHERDHYFHLLKLSL